MKNKVSWKDLLPASILAVVFLLRFDAVTATVVFVATACGVFAARKHYVRKDKR